MSGTYDSAAWLYQKLPTVWTDPVRGSIPLGWAFNPNLADRFPVGLDWVHRTASTNDHFITGGLGGGLPEPRQLGWRSPVFPFAIWLGNLGGPIAKPTTTNGGLSLTGFVIDGDAPPMSAAALAAYARFSPDGIVAQKTAVVIRGLFPARKLPI